jgi:hypothetical protein
VASSFERRVDVVVGRVFQALLAHCKTRQWGLCALELNRLLLCSCVPVAHQTGWVVDQGP